MAAAMISATKASTQTCQVATKSQTATATPSTWKIIGHGRRDGRLVTPPPYVAARRGAAQRWTVRRVGAGRFTPARIQPDARGLQLLAPPARAPAPPAPANDH